MKKYLICLFVLAFMSLAFTGCGKKCEDGIDGLWVKTEIVESDGTVLKGDDIGPTEVYKIEGDRAWYSTSFEINDKEVGMELAIVEVADEMYDFRMIVKGEVSERLSLLQNVKFDGNKMTAEMPNGSQFVFKRK